LTHLADAVLFLVDASGECGYPLDAQLDLRDDVRDRFRDVSVVTVCNKSDRSVDVDADFFMSVETGENVDEVLDAVVGAVDHEPDLPFEGS
jgi:nucleolar GTP-binding protein